MSAHILFLDLDRPRKRPPYAAMLAQRQHGSRLPGASVAPQVDAEVTSALWSAVHALEDTASAARWRQTQPAPPAYLVGQIRDAQREADLIREFIRQSAAGS